MISFIIDQLFLLVVLMAMAAGAVYPLPANVASRMAAAPDKSAKDAIWQEYLAIPAIKQRQGNSMRFWFVLAVAYHIAMRRTRGGTLGHRLAGIRLIDCHNESPPWRTLVKRFFLGTALAGPFGASYFLCLKDPKRQALHDRWCSTWMVRRDALPAGSGAVAYRLQSLGPWAISYIAVEPLTDSATSSRASCLHDYGNGDNCRLCGITKLQAADIPPGTAGSA